MICRAAAHSSASVDSPSRVVDVGDDLVEYAKRLRDEGHDPTLSLEAIIALAEEGGGGESAGTSSSACAPAAVSSEAAHEWAGP